MHPNELSHLKYPISVATVNYSFKQPSNLQYLFTFLNNPKRQKKFAYSAYPLNNNNQNKGGKLSQNLVHFFHIEFFDNYLQMKEKLDIVY